VLDVGRLTIPAGRITAVVGPNGSGKTTLLEVLALLRRPTGGRLCLWDQAATPPRRHLRRRVVMVMHPGFLFQGTVWDNVTFGLRARGVKRRAAADQAAEALGLVGLSGFAARNVAALSAGERQRVNLARALAVRPEALLLDEPTANVDTRTAEVVGGLLVRLRDAHRTTILHTAAAANGLLDVSDLVVRLEGGKIRDNGRPPEGPGRGGQSVSLLTETEKC
jgi:ABC-type multidrug transport system ATPase subunit